MDSQPLTKDPGELAKIDTSKGSSLPFKDVTENGCISVWTKCKSPERPTALIHILHIGRRLKEKKKMTFILMISFLMSAVNPTGLAFPENVSDSKPLVPGVGRDRYRRCQKSLSTGIPIPPKILACEKIQIGATALLVKNLF